MEETDIIYILKDTPENEELKYSLRSLINFPHKRVVFVGGKPNGLEPDIWISAEQHGATKWDNSRDLIKLACEDDRLTAEVFLFNDDFFAVRPVRNMPVYMNGSLAELAKHVTHNGTRRSDYIDTRILPTIHELQAKRLTTINYELHVPMLINRHKMLEVYRKFPKMVAKRSFYGNYYHLGGVDIDPNGMNDGSVQSPKDKFNTNRTFVSTTDESWVGEVGKQIKKIFITPSRYEK